jgi:hypothetical protein
VGYDQWDGIERSSQERPFVCPHHLCGRECYPKGCINFICNICAPILQVNKADPSTLLVHSKIYEIADKNAVTSLKDLARSKFAPLCMDLWDEEVFAQAAEHAPR